MKKNLPATKQDSKVILSKTKSIMGLTNKVLNNKLELDDESWMQRLWDWADENEIPDLEFIEEYDEEDGYVLYDYKYWIGLPRDKEKLLTFGELYFTIINISNGISNEIYKLVNLKKLFIIYDYNKGRRYITKSRF